MYLVEVRGRLGQSYDALCAPWLRRLRAHLPTILLGARPWEGDMEVRGCDLRLA